jgi:hypothetical protein
MNGGEVQILDDPFGFRNEVEFASSLSSCFALAVHTNTVLIIR